MSAAWDTYWRSMAIVGYWIGMGLMGLLMVCSVYSWWTTRHMKEDS